MSTEHSSTRKATAAASPLQHAVFSGVMPLVVIVSTRAPRAHSSRAILMLPTEQATWKGVVRSSVGSSTSTPSQSSR